MKKIWFLLCFITVVSFVFVNFAHASFGKSLEQMAAAQSNATYGGLRCCIPFGSSLLGAAIVGHSFFGGMHSDEIEDILWPGVVSCYLSAGIGLLLPDKYKLLSYFLPIAVVCGIAEKKGKSLMKSGVITAGIVAGFILSGYLNLMLEHEKGC